MGRLFPQTFAGAVYNVCIRGCKRYPWRTHVFAFKVDQIGPGGCSALRLSLQTFATVPANVCGIRRLSGRNGSLVAGYMQSKVQHLHFEPCPSALS